MIFDEEEIDLDQEISIYELRLKFESLGLQSKKSTQLARYLVEPPSQGEIIANDNLKALNREVL